jgi:hypothetical protein
VARSKKTTIFISIFENEDTQIMMHSIFGIPIYSSKIPPELYNKNTIIDSISKNFAVDNNRNYWDQTQNYKSNLHHMSNNFEDSNFLKIDFEELYPLYQNEIINCLRQIGFNEIFECEIEICNYTCMKEGHYMKEHVHTSDFVAVHYLQFDADKHSPTVFSNDQGYSSYINTLFPKLREKINSEKISNSWTSKYFNFPTKEDDFIIAPGILHHLVPPFSNSDILRMTIVTNIKLL